MTSLSDTYVNQLISELRNCNSLGRFLEEAEELLLSNSLADSKDKVRLITYIKNNKRRKDGQFLNKKEKLQITIYRRYFVEKWSKTQQEKAA